MDNMTPFWGGLQPGYAPLFGRGLLDNMFGYHDMGGFRADVREEEDRYELRAELPGIDPQQICVSVENGMLTIAADLNEESGREGAYERRSGHFHRSFHLDGIDEEAVTARSHHGVLLVTLPKKREHTGAKARRIEVR